MPRTEETPDNSNHRGAVPQADWGTLMRVIHPDFAAAEQFVTAQKAAQPPAQGSTNNEADDDSAFTKAVSDAAKE